MHLDFFSLTGMFSFSSSVLLLLFFFVTRCQDSSLYLDAVDMLTVAHLYCVSLAFRLAIGGVTTAISSGVIGCND